MAGVAAASQEELRRVFDKFASLELEGERYLSHEDFVIKAANANIEFLTANTM